MMKCPRCGSSTVTKKATAKQTGAAIGGVGGVLKGLSTVSIGASIALIAGGSSSGLATTLGRAAAIITAALVSGAAGCIAGARIGTVVDHYVFDAYRCSHCNCSFRTHLPTELLPAQYAVELRKPD